MLSQANVMQLKLAKVRQMQCINAHEPPLALLSSAYGPWVTFHMLPNNAGKAEFLRSFHS